MEYEEKVSMKDDTIKFCRIISLDIFQIKIIRILLFLTLLGLTTLELVQTYLFLEKFDALYFIKYAPAFILLCIITIPYTSNIILKTFEKLSRWEFGCAGPEIERKIKKESKVVTHFFIFYIILGAMSAVFHMIPDADDPDMCYPFMLFEKHFPQWKNYLKNIDMNLKATDSNTYSEECQNKVKKRLLFCISRLIGFYVEGKKAIRSIKYLIFLFTVIGGLLIISVSFFIISFQDILSGKYLRITTLGLAVFLLPVYLLVTGQEIEDIKKFKIQFTENMSINYDLGTA
ncbi:hypothetical protein BDFB_005961, partial [Asbolus verrucosus]